MWADGCVGGETEGSFVEQKIRSLIKGGYSTLNVDFQGSCVKLVVIVIDWYVYEKMSIS